MASKTKIIKPFEGFQDRFVRSNLDFVIGGGSMGGGKLHPLDTNILTPNGWVKMGDLKVGDFVCTPFGKPAEVLQIFEHHDKDIYELTTNDGRKTKCGLEHLWSVRTTKQLHKYRQHHDVSKNMTTCETSQLIEWLNDDKAIFIPTPHAQEFEEKEYIIPPYLLGILIGDGCLTVNGKSITISSQEEDIINKCYQILKTSRLYRNPTTYSKTFYFDKCEEYKSYLESVGLNTYSHNKFIPREYLWGSIEQRRQLLYGLMDTDGCVEIKNRYSFSTTSERLANDFIYLCRSLGYIATLGIDDRENKYTKKKAFDIRIHTDDVIFSSEKHMNRYKKNVEKNRRKYARTNDHVRIISIEKVSKEDARCIWIDDPLHLYIVDDFISTHNTAAAVLCIAEPSLDSRFRAVYLRNNLGDLKSGGGILDEFKKMYIDGKGCNVVESGDPHVDFPSGARVDVTHIADQSKDKVLQRFKGRQYDFIYFDEGTGFTWECFTAVYSRNRGMANWTGKVRMTTNPKRNHWLRTFLDWYIGADGFIIPERDGVVRYFFINGETVNDVVWGDTKEEVYNKCKIQIDRTLEKFNGKNGKATPYDMIKSFTFYEGKMSGNKAILENNAGYIGSVAVMGGREAQANLEGNWNVDTDEDLDAVITSDVANQVFLSDPQINNDKWVTCDLADSGTDNFLALAWNGFHIYDKLILSKTTPRQNAESLEMFAAHHDISNSHIIYDAIRGTYINDYIPEAMQFVSYRAPVGLYARMAYNLKAECYLRLVEALKRGNISMEESVAMSNYDHIGFKEAITMQCEFLEECSVVRFKDMPSGKKNLLSKKEMNKMLGKNRSMDLLDPIAMRMLPCLPFPYGEELEKTAQEITSDKHYNTDGVDIYDSTFWGA